MAFNTPTAKQEQVYLVSLEHTDKEYRQALVDAWSQRLNLPNKYFDTGRETRAGEYILTDKAYARLLDDVAKRHFAHVTPDLRENIIAFYANPSAPIATKHDRKKWDKTMSELDQLRSLPVNPQPAQPSAGGRE
jgi:hypothetical protein